ncbi:hypothetical protein RFI_26740, partial [Reticulomyxa filosa]
NGLNIIQNKERLKDIYNDCNDNNKLYLSFCDKNVLLIVKQFSCWTCFSCGHNFPYKLFFFNIPTSFLFYCYSLEFYLKEYLFECSIVRLASNLGYVMTQQKKFTSASSIVERLHAKDALDVLKRGLIEMLAFSVSTLKNFLKSQGLNSCIRIKKHRLTKRHKKLRLEFDKKHKSLTESVWRKVIFSDETKINRASDAAKITGTVNSELYKKILADEMWNYRQYCLEEKCHEDFIFQQDNASCHKSNSTMEFLENNRIALLKHPPQSPDLNPIENMWRIIKIKIHQNHDATSLKQLWEVFEKEFEDIDKDICRTLVPIG